MPREYHTPVRDQRRAETGERILRALAETIAEHGVTELGVQEVAERAGVTHRTVYRHFPDRQTLLDALGGWMRDELSRGLDEQAVQDVAGLLEALRWVFAGFDELGDPVVAMARLAVAEGIPSAQHRDRSALFEQILAPSLEGLDDPAAVFSVLRHLMSAVTWWMLRSEFDLDGDRAGRAVATVAQAVITEAERSQTRDQ